METRGDCIMIKHVHGNKRLAEMLQHVNRDRAHRLRLCTLFTYYQRKKALRRQRSTKKHCKVHFASHCSVALMLPWFCFQRLAGTQALLYLMGTCSLIYKRLASKIPQIPFSSMILKHLLYREAIKLLNSSLLIYLSPVTTSFCFMKKDN